MIMLKPGRGGGVSFGQKGVFSHLKVNEKGGVFVAAGQGWDLNINIECKYRVFLVMVVYINFLFRKGIFSTK